MLPVVSSAFVDMRLYRQEPVKNWFHNGVLCCDTSFGVRSPHSFPQLRKCVRLRSISRAAACLCCLPLRPPGKRRCVEVSFAGVRPCG